MLSKFIILLLANVLVAQTGPTPVLADESDAKRPRLDAQCSSYAQCAVKGKFYWDKLVETIQHHDPRGDKDRSQIFEVWYGASPEDQGDAGDELSEDLKNHGLSPIEEYQNWFVYAKSSEEHTHLNPYQNLINTKDGVIIATYNYRKDDMAQKLQWSDIIYQCYLEELTRTHQSGRSIAGLQTVIQANILNMGTIDVARAAYLSIGTQLWVEPDWKRWTIAETPYWFYALLGTENIKGVLWLLRDHPVAIGNKVVTEIWTRVNGNFDIWINIGPYEPATMQEPREGNSVQRDIAFDLMEAPT